MLGKIPKKYTRVEWKLNTHEGRRVREGVSAIAALGRMCQNLRWDLLLFTACRVPIFNGSNTFSNFLKGNTECSEGFAFMDLRVHSHKRHL